jgi:hypothetical protein
MYDIMLLDTRMIALSFWIIETALLRFMTSFYVTAKETWDSRGHRGGCNVPLLNTKNSSRRKETSIGSSLFLCFKLKQEKE